MFFSIILELENLFSRACSLAYWICFSHLLKNKTKRGNDDQAIP